MSLRASGRVVHDLLRMSETEREEVLALLTKGLGPGASINTRMALPVDTLDVQMKQLGGTTAWHRVWPRDISQTGLGFIHGAFVHPGVACSVALPTLDGEVLAVAATVARCEHIRGRAHFVGVRFDEVLALHRFVPGVPAPPAADPQRGKPAGRSIGLAELKSLAGQLVSMSASKSCPAPIRKLANQLAEAIGAMG